MMAIDCQDHDLIIKSRVENWMMTEATFFPSIASLGSIGGWPIRFNIQLDDASSNWGFVSLNIRWFRIVPIR